MKKYKINVEYNIFEMILMILLFIAIYEFGGFLGECLLNVLK